LLVFYPAIITLCFVALVFPIVIMVFAFAGVVFAFAVVIFLYATQVLTKIRKIFVCFIVVKVINVIILLSHILKCKCIWFTIFMED